MVSADIHQEIDSPEESAPRITFGDYFVFASTSLVALALAAGLMAQLDIGVLIAVAIAAAAFVAMMTGHFALRRADGRSASRDVHPDDADLEDPLDRRPTTHETVRPSLPPVDAPKAPSSAKGSVVRDAADKPNTDKAAKPLNDVEDDTVALKDMDLGKFRPRSPADLAQPSKGSRNDETEGGGNIDDMIKRLADDIEAGRKSIDEDAPNEAVKTETPAAMKVSTLEGLEGVVPKKSSSSSIGQQPPPIPPIGAAAMAPPATPTPRLAPTMTEAATPPALPTKAPKAPQSATAKLAAIADALSDEQMDVFLETINDLEDYRAQHYEVSVRLRLDSGEVLNNDAFIAETRGTGLLPLLEAVKVSSTKRLAVQMIRRGRTGDFFSTIDGEALIDQQFGEDVDTIAGGDAGLAARLVLAFTQNDVRNLSPAQVKTLESIAALGFRFSIEEITDLDMDFEQLAQRGFKFAKLDADVFLAGLPTGMARVPSQDICAHLAKSGLSVIIGKIEDEAARAKILGFGAIFGQGPLFGAARPVRADMLRPGSEQRPPAM